MTSVHVTLLVDGLMSVNSALDCINCQNVALQVMNYSGVCAVLVFKVLQTFSTCSVQLWFQLLTKNGRHGEGFYT